MAKFEQTSCSQCGCDLGPGESGVSHCEDHAPKSDRFLRAYFHEFAPTGDDRVDAILEAIALAGKAYHNTSAWDDAEEYGPEGYWTLIQKRANEAASTGRDRKPLTDGHISVLLDAIDFKKMVTADDLFYLIARSVERAHGIGTTKEAA